MSTVTLSGLIQWTDGAGNTHPVRQSTVEIWDEDTFLALGDKKVKTISTDINGSYSTTFDNDDGGLQGNRDIYIKVFADSPFHFVQDPKPLIDQTHVFKSNVWDIPNGSHTWNITLPNNSNLGRAFSVGDAVYTAGRAAQILRGSTPKLEINFPVKADDSFFEPGGFFDKTDLNITSSYRWAWDVIHHEYGHYLEYLDNLDNSPGGKHARGISNITGGTTSNGYQVPAYGKDKGVRLAWSEGLADYLALASQSVAATAGFLPAVPGVGDTFYDATNADNPANSFRVNREGGSPNAGEGDESSVARILWDLADGKNEPHDKISLGHINLYNILNNQIANLDRLDDVWDYFFGISNDATRVDYGAIFEQYDVSPAPFGGPIGQTFQLGNGSAIPTLQWTKNNNNANDQFQVIVFNNDFSKRELDYLIPGNVTQWTPTQNQWNQVVDTPGEYHFVIAGSDTDTFSTGSYWSGAYDFLVAPPPSTAFNPKNGHIYFLTDRALGTSWTDTQAQASSVGGNLVTINDADENQWLTATFGTAESFWIGLNDANTEGTFEWVSGETVTYTNWANGEPNNLGGENYAEINPTFAPGRWNDRLVFASEIGGRGIVEVNPNIIGTEGSDSRTGTSGNDGILGLGGNDTIAGGLGNDIILGGDGDDVLRGDLNTRDPQVGSGGDDIIDGGKGSDRIGGKGGNDKLYGSEGDDQMWGDDGDDLLRGGLGSDTLTGDDYSGGRGRDTFVLAPGEGTDTVTDFHLGEDFIGLAGSLTFSALNITSQGANALIGFGSEPLAVLNGINANNLISNSATTFISI
jgi:Ca2+-binding RTX toxin-like protein